MRPQAGLTQPYVRLCSGHMTARFSCPADPERRSGQVQGPPHQEPQGRRVPFEAQVASHAVTPLEQINAAYSLRRHVSDGDIGSLTEELIEALQGASESEHNDPPEARFNPDDLKDDRVLRRRRTPPTRLSAMCADVQPFGDGQVGSEPRHITLESLQRQLDMVIDSHYNSGASLRQELGQLQNAFHEDQASRARTSSADQNWGAAISDLRHMIEALDAKFHECFEEVYTADEASDESSEGQVDDAADYRALADRVDAMEADTSRRLSRYSRVLSVGRTKQRFR